MQVEEFIKWYGPNFFTLLREDYLIPAFQKMALTYSVSTSKLYDTVHDYEYDEEELGETEDGKFWRDYSRPEEVIRSYYRFRGIIERLSTIDVSTPEMDEGLLFFCPKVFDDILQDTLISTYNMVASVWGIAQITHMVPKNYIERSMLDTSDQKLNLIEDITDYSLPNAGYTLPLTSMERSALTFVECAVLSCIYSTFYRQAVPTLNRPLETESQKKRARGRFKKAIEIVYSKDFYISLCRTALDIVTDFCLPEDMDKLHERAENYRLSKDVAPNTSPVKKHLKKPHEASLISTFIAIYLSHRVFPVAELILMEVFPNNESTVLDGKCLSDLDTAFLQAQDVTTPSLDFSNNVKTSKIISKATKKNLDENEVYKVSQIAYWLACKVADAIGAYITQVQHSVIELLRSLPEFKEFDEKLIIKYSENKY